MKSLFHVSLTKFALFAFLIISLASCSKAIDMSKYQEASKVWEKEIQQLEAKDKAETDPQNAILFVGSSSVRLWKNIETDMQPYPVIQRGYGGSKFSDNIFYIERLVKSHDFRALVMFFANDITGSNNDRTPEELTAIVKETIKKVRTIKPDKPVFLIEITPTNSRWKVWTQAKQANELLKNMSQKMKNVYFIETAAAYLDAEGKPRGELFIADQLHQNQKGYDIWSAIIKKRLDEVLKLGIKN